jgi:dihydroorotase
LQVVTSAPGQLLSQGGTGVSPSAGRLQVGASADVCVYDPSTVWPVHAQALRSQCKHTPFAFDIGGSALPGAVRATWVGGRQVFCAA